MPTHLVTSTKAIWVVMIVSKVLRIVMDTVYKTRVTTYMIYERFRQRMASTREISASVLL